MIDMLDANTVISILHQYWGIIAVILGFGVYAIFQRQTTKKIILSLMLQLEKEAETLALATGDAKFQFLVDKGYQLLPQGARVFITPAMFTSLAQNLYDKAKSYLSLPKTEVPEKEDKEKDQQTA